MYKVSSRILFLALLCCCRWICISSAPNQPVIEGTTDQRKPEEPSLNDITKQSVAAITTSVPTRPSPSPASVTRKRQPPTPPAPGSMSMGSVTMTVPTMPPPVTNTSAPGPSNKDLSKIINLLFAILLVVTAILMVVAGLCLMGLRRQYLRLTGAPPKYKELKASII